MTTHNVGQGSPSLQPVRQDAQPPIQPGDGVCPSSSVGGGGTMLDPSNGFFWDAPLPPEEERITAGQAAYLDSNADKSGLVTLARSFLDEIERRHDRINPLKLDGPISASEWKHARASQPPIVDRWFYEDVGCFIAPGGTGKTTLLLFQIIHIVLGRDLFGHRIRNTGTVVLLTAEDSRETLVARLRYMCTAMSLTEAEMASEPDRKRG